MKRSLYLLEKIEKLIDQFNDLNKVEKCELCGHVLCKKPIQKNNEPAYPPIGETIDELKVKYIKAVKHAFTIGNTQGERLIIGRAVRKISWCERKKILLEIGLWEEGIIYKCIMTKEGLLKKVPDKPAMYRRKALLKKKNKMREET